MEEVKKQLILLGVLIFILMVFVVIYKSDYFWVLAKGFPLHTNSGNCTQITDNICLSEDSGLKVNYYEASSICSKRGMRLPSREEAWAIWINSENCQRAYASNIEIPKNKKAFISACEDDNCLTFGSKSKNYCSDTPSIKFPIAYQYKGGYFWLKDKADSNRHYVFNYSTGKIKSANNLKKEYGVRCVSGK